jgi:hypothetical protein
MLHKTCNHRHAPVFVQKGRRKHALRACFFIASRAPENVFLPIISSAQSAGVTNEKCWKVIPHTQACFRALKRLKILEF